jgi:arylsulfatase A-like enzyme
MAFPGFLRQRIPMVFFKNNIREKFQRRPGRFACCFILFRLFVCWLCWLLLNHIPAEIPVTDFGRLLIRTAAAETMVFESCLLLLLLGSVKFWRRKSAQQLRFRPLFRLLSATSVLLVCGALCFVLLSAVMSWNFAAHRLDFLSITAVDSAVRDFPTLLPFLSTRELLLILLSAGVAAVIVRCLYILVPELGAPLSAKLGGLMLLTGGLCFVSVRLLPSFGERTAANRIHAAFESSTLPTVKLLWAPLIFYQPSAPPVVDESLAKILPLAEYRKSVVPTASRKNILVFALEAMRADVVGEAPGGREIVPEINRLAQQGINFTRAYSTGNESLYSMTSIISGLSPLKNSHRDRFSPIDYPLTRIFDLFSSVYATAFISSANEYWQNMIAVTEAPSLDEFFHAPLFHGQGLPVPTADSGLARAVASGKLKTGKLDDATTSEHLMDWISRTRQQQPDKPFFAFVSYQSSHFPYEQGLAIPSLFVPDQLTPEEERSLSFFDYPAELSERMRNRYWNSLHYTDAQIGRIVEFLKKNGLYDDTIILVFGDHGELFRENGSVTHAARLFNATIHVALVLSGADQYPQGEYRAAVSLLDINPLLLELGGLPQFPGFQGRIPPGLKDLAPSEAEQFHPVFSTVQNIAVEDSIILGRWKFSSDPLGSIEKLYDIEADPWETRNVANLPETDAVTGCLRASLKDFRRRQLAYYGSEELKRTYFQPQHGLSPLYCDAENFAR